MEKLYRVKKLKDEPGFKVTVPGSKSVTNRALMLAALAKGKCVLEGVLFSDDSRAFLDCLTQLGFELDINEHDKMVTIVGAGGDIPNRSASINVRSAGTAARFLTVMLSFAGGEYYLESSAQMKKRPMEPLISLLRDAGVDIICLEAEGHFPFKIKSSGINVNELTVDTEVSSQFASAVMMAGNIVKGGVKLNLTGSRIEGSYIQITRRMLEQFGIVFDKQGAAYILKEGSINVPSHYIIEPDVSAACYFWAMAAVNARKILVRRVSFKGMQGDLKFLEVLKQMGCSVGESPEGVWVSGTDRLKGISVDMKDFSDQTMTLAAIAPFAKGVTEIRNITHIRGQECDRINAIIYNLKKMGIESSVFKENANESIRINPGEIKPAEIETFEDHRLAMAFAVVGTRCEGIDIINPDCCAKTFENYFDVLDSITV